MTLAFGASPRADEIAPAPSAAMRSVPGTAKPGRNFITRLMIICFASLVLAQILTGALAVASLQRLFVDMVVAKVEVVGARSTARIENSIRFGKTLNQLLGLKELLSEIDTDLVEVNEAAVMLPNGTVLESVKGSLELSAEALSPTAAPSQTAQSKTVRPSGSIVGTFKNKRYVALPIRSRDGAVMGYLVLGLDPRAIDEKARPAALHNVGTLLATTSAALLGIALAFALAFPRGSVPLLPRSYIFSVPIFALFLAQGLYAVDTVATFRSSYLQVTKATAESLATAIQRDVDRLLRAGVSITSLNRIEEPLSRLAKAFPEVLAIELTDGANRVFNRATATSVTVAEPGSRPTVQPDEFTVRLPLGVLDANAAKMGELVILLDRERVWAGVLRRILDAATITLVAAVFVAELFLLLTILLPKRVAGRHPTDLVDTALTEAEHNSDVAKVGRPLIAAFLFAWALPLSFLPLYARGLTPAFLSIPANTQMALPIAAEMLCALLTALFAGALTDRRGWHVPTLLGITLSLFGTLLSSQATNLEGFMLARGLVGAGYGLAWIGVQGFVVLRSTASGRAENLARLVAGIYAGHLAGTAVGAMLAEQFGYPIVFVVGAVTLLAPLIGAMILYRSVGTGKTVTDPQRAASAPMQAAPAAPRRSISRLILSRDFGALLLGSVVPFSIAQVGLLYFAVPIYLESQGVAASDIGRVLMAYGLSVIWLGPWVGRFIDRQPNKRMFVPIGGIAGAAGLGYLLIDGSFWGVLIAVIMMSLAGLVTQAAQSSYALALDRVQSFGPGFAFAVQRSADKFGQMLGPFVIGALIAGLGTTEGLAFAGVGYAILTIAFFVVSAPSRRRVTAHVGAVPAQ
jgi:predicted MFS family arabinose efflux permease